MSLPPDREPGKHLAIIEEVGDELRRLFHAAQERETARGRRGFSMFRAWRWRPLAAIVVLVLGGTTAALAAAGVFQTGTPIGASVLAQTNAFEGVAIPSTVQLLSLRVPDPDGGPPWALRALRTTRGLECVQLGRLVDGRLGVLGQDDAFANDGRFHPLSPNALEFTFNCGTLDARGHSFANDILYGIAASGLVRGNTRTGGCYAASSVRRRAPRGPRLRNRRPPGPVCPEGSLHDVYFGMLGPDATSVTYTTPSGRQATTATAGPDGAYLIVLPHTSGSQGESGGTTLTDYGTNPIRSVNYTGGRTCNLAALPGARKRAAAQADAELRKRFPALAAVAYFGGPRRPLTKQQSATVTKITRSAAFRNFELTHLRALNREGTGCPLIGYTAPKIHLVTSAQVKTPIRARVETASSYCQSPTFVTQPCGAITPPGLSRVPARIARTNDLLVVTWRTRVAIKNQDSHYEIYNTNTGAGHKNCATAGTSFGPTESNYHAGQQATYTSWLPRQCPGISHGSVTYVQDTGAAGPNPVPAQPGEGPDIPLGTFTVKIP
jgi:hypothetical protein